MKNGWKFLAVACVLVMGMYAYTAPLGRLETSVSTPADGNYNLLVQGFRAGQLSLKREAPPGLVKLADPYDSDANRRYQDLPYGLRDTSYYKGRLYLYFGVTPALILFWPYVSLTGHYLSDRLALAVCCAIGVLASIGLLRALWRRYFPEVKVGVMAACAVALGLASGLPTMLPRSEVHEVAAGCGYMLTMLSLGAIWCALHETKWRAQWLAAASLTFGLALGARPNLLFGGVILLMPVLQAWRERRPILALLVAATGPVVLIGLGLMLYNALRFDNPFEFGWRYQLAGKRQLMMQSFSLRYLWYNFRVYFLEPVRWSARFPFLRPITVSPPPAGYYGVDTALGILTNIPLAWLALAVPLAWRRRSSQEASALRWFVAATTLLFGVSAITVGLFCASNTRYAVDFLPALMLLAVVGVLSLERALTDQPARRRLVRWGWSALLGVSVVFNVLVSIVDYAHVDCGLATVLALKGRVPQAIEVFEKALRITPDYTAGHIGLGRAFCRAGRWQEALREQVYAVRLDPGNAEAHSNYGVVLQQLGEVPEAIAQFEQALRIDPDYVEAHNNLGVALVQAGKIAEAITHYERVLRIDPEFADAHYNCGVALQQLGEVPEAVAQYEYALRLNPGSVDAHNNLGTTLAQGGKFAEAISQYEQALRIKPDDVGAHFNLGSALEALDRTAQAAEQYEQALKLEPSFTPAKDALARLRAGR